jgi:polysaccharide export outer membrane protein
MVWAGPANDRRDNSIGKGLIAARCVVVIAALTVAGQSAAAEYTVQRGDTIEIAVAGIPELHQRGAVQQDGAIAFPLVGAIAVEGLTPAQLRAEIQRQLGRKIYRQRANDGREILIVIQPDEVSASIVAYRPIYVTGAVVKPGEQEFRPEMTVRQAVALAGGTNSFTSRSGNTALETAALKGDYDTLVNDLAAAITKVARVNAELNEAETLGAVDYSDTPLAAEVLEATGKLEADVLKARIADYRRERGFLQSAVAEADDRIAVVQKLQAEEEQGARADTADLQRLIDLLSRGQETNPRITEARRALLLSSTRTLQVSVELLELNRQKSESVRKLQQFEDDRRIALLKELQDSVSATTTLRLKKQAVGSQLREVAGPGSLLTIERESLPNYRLVRQGKNASTVLAVDGDFVLAPGDVIEVTLSLPPATAHAKS